MLKEKLLSLELVVNNEYLDKYVELIESCKNNKSIKTQTQRHHIVPLAYYKENKLDTDNSKNNLVNLYHYQHILAHWYLYKCAKPEYFIYSNCYALLYMLRVHQLPDNEDQIITDAINYGEVYTDFCVRQSKKYKGKPGPTKGRKPSLETRKKLSESHKGKTQSEYTKEKRKQTLLRMYAEGKIDRTVSEQTRQKLHDSISGRKWINNGSINKQIKPEELNEYLSSGWTLGQFFTAEQHKARSDAQRGRKVSEQTRKKQSIAAKNRDPSTRKLKYHYSYKCLNNGKENKRAYTCEQEQFLLEQGFVHGTLKQIEKERNKQNKLVNEKLWKSWEDQIIKDNYAKVTKEELLFLLPCREWSAIRARANILKVTRPYKRFNRCQCIETGVIYNSFAEAARDCDINADTISNCCKGNQKTAGGLHWIFIDVKEEN